MKQAHAAGSPGRRKRRSAFGFTLMELLVSLAVLGAASSVFISIFSGGLAISKSARSRGAATLLAEEYLAAIQRDPGRFIWKIPKEPDGALFPILVSEEDPKAGNLVERPETMPVVEGAYIKENILYGQFRWKASGRVPGTDEAYLEIFVSLKWEESGREQELQLSSAIPRSRVEGQ